MQKKSSSRKKSPTQVLKQRLKPNAITIGILSVILIVVGVFIFAAQAGTTPWEVEQWTKSGTNVQQISDSSASNNSAIRFGQASSSPTPTSTPTANNCSATPPAGYTTLSFCDDFASLDTAKWENGWFTAANAPYSNPVNDREDSRNDTRQVSTGEGNLKITTATNTDANCKLKNGSVAPYKSGLINTRKSFSQAYGYFEARMYLPGTNNAIHNWPAFWTNGYHTKWPDRGEIDIAEVNSDHVPNNHYHYGPTSTDLYAGYGKGHTLSPVIGWHTYAVKWEPGKITWIYDGAPVASLPDSRFPNASGITSDPHYVIFNNPINIDYGAYPNQTMLVDYVRVWK